MSTYVDEWGNHVSRATVTVTEETKSARVTYRGEDGKRFRVDVVQKPNPIGFGAKLPGDRHSRPSLSKLLDGHSGRVEEYDWGRRSTVRN